MVNIKQIFQKIKILSSTYNFSSSPLIFYIIILHGPYGILRYIRFIEFISVHTHMYSGLEVYFRRLSVPEVVEQLAFACCVFV